MPPAASMVGRLYITVIQCNACCLYDFLVVQSSYANATCRQSPLWCAGCILLSYSAMCAGCIISWLYTYLMPMPHGAGHSYSVPGVYYWHAVQWLKVFACC